MLTISKSIPKYGIHGRCSPFKCSLSSLLHGKDKQNSYNNLTMATYSFPVTSVPITYQNMFCPSL